MEEKPPLLLIIRLSICNFCKVTHCYTDELSKAKGREREKKGRRQAAEGDRVDQKGK